MKRGLTEQEVAYFLNIDFVDHVALVAVLEEANRPVIVGGARYIVLESGKAEVGGEVYLDSKTSTLRPSTRTWFPLMGT